MPWLRHPHQLLSRLLRIGTTIWICRKIGCWLQHFGRFGALLLRFVGRGRPARRMPDYGHLLLDPLYPGRQPSTEASRRAHELAEMSQQQEEPEDRLRMLGEAVLLCPPDASLHLLRAEAHVGSGQLVEALDDVELAVSLDSTLASGWLVKGQVEWALGRTSDAALSYQAGLRIEPSNAELYSRLEAARAEPPPNMLRQLRDLVFAARLGLENLFRTVEDPEKTTDAFVEQNSELLDAQIGLLQQTLRVNTAVLLESPILCEAYEQIVHACAQLVAGAPSAFSRRLQNATGVVEGLSLALRVGWHVHHSAPKLAANALVTLATCPDAEDGLRRQAVRHLLAGLLRWLLDATPEPDREGEEVCGCSCSAPWKAAACFLERLLEPGKPPQPWIREECERWPDAAQLCQWLTLSVRDYHATPLGLVGLLQLPGIAAAVMRSEAVVDFFIPVLVPDDEFDASDEEHAEGLARGGDGSIAIADVAVGGGSRWWQAADVAVGGGRSLMSPPASAPVAETTNQSSSEPASLEGTATPGVLGEGSVLLPAQRLGEWLMASVGYLLLFVEGDVLFTVAACRALQAMAMAEPEEHRGTRRLLSGLWLGVPLLNKLSLYACSHTAALDLLHCFFEGSDRGVRVAARSLAAALSRPPAPTPAEAANDEIPDQDLLDTGEEAGPDAALPAPVAGPAMPPPHLLEDEGVPTWAEFYQELRTELSCNDPSSGGIAGPSDLVTLVNFEEKVPLLVEQVSIKTDGENAPSLDIVAVPAAWNRLGSGSSADEGGLPLNLPLRFSGSEVEGEEHDIGSDGYIADVEKRGCVVLMSRRSIRQSSRVLNWAQAVAAAERAGAAAVIVFNNLDVLEPFRMHLFGEPAPTIPAFMVGGGDGASLANAARTGCSVQLARLEPSSSQDGTGAARWSPPPWPLSSFIRLPADVAQAWSLLEALAGTSKSSSDSSSSNSTGTDADDADDVQAELAALLARMDAPDKRVWLTRRLVRHHRSMQGDTTEPPLAFVEGDRSLSPAEQLEALRRQLCEETGLGAEDLCGEFEVRFKEEQGVGSALLREWMDFVAHEVFLHPSHRLLQSYDRRQTFWPDPAALFVNPQWQMDYEALGRLIGLALWQNCTLDLPLHPHICALLFGISRKTTLADCDAELDRHKAKWLLAHPVAELGIELSYSDTLMPDEKISEGEDEHVDENPDHETNHSARRESLPALVLFRDRLPGDLRSCPGRARKEVRPDTEVLLPDQDDNAIVTDENKACYVAALEEWRLFRSTELQIEAMARGLRIVVPEPVLSDLRGLISAEEMVGLLSGVGDIDVDDWEQHTAYSQGFSRNTNLVQWFWRTLRSWTTSPEEAARLAQLLQFVTGSARVPVGGFAELVGFNGAKHPFTLSYGAHLTPQSLPMAHACICTLDLPPYPDEETCRAKLTQTLLLGRSPFDEAAGQAVRGEEDD